MPTAYLSHPDCLRHEMGSGHPESPDRLHAIEDELRASGLMRSLQRHDAPLATLEQLARVHDSAYIEEIQAAAPHTGYAALDPDTMMNSFTWNAALRAAGAVVHAVDLVMSGKADNAFCAVRPPGHHAESARAMGFCIFNNVSVGVAHGLEQHGLQRVAIMDFDVHHGNGTENIFHDDPRVMLCSTFQHPYYPFSGANSGNAHIINVPLAAGTGSKVYREAVMRHCLPALEDFQPEMIFFSAGFDAHHQDPLAQLNLQEDDYTWVTAQVKAIAERHAHGRIVSTLEGGYELSALAQSALAHIKVLADAP